jgi:hypothetical protein
MQSNFTGLQSDAQLKALYTYTEMNTFQKWIASGFGFLFLLALCFPPWRQTHQGHPLTYNEHLGHHFIWPAPSPTGEKSWILTVSATECQTSIERKVLLIQLGGIVVMAAILLFVFRRQTPISLTTRVLIFTSLSLSLCLPTPPPDGPPLIVWVGAAVASPFMDNGHVGPWFTPMVAGSALAVYSTVMFILLKAAVWLAIRRSQNSLL